MKRVGSQLVRAFLRALWPFLFAVLCVLFESAARADFQPDPGYQLSCPEVGAIESPFPTDLPAPPPWETARVGAAAGSFSVTPTGEATYTIPLVVQPGRAGLEPHLAVTYNSGAGDGLLGMGFSLSGLSAVTRCPRTLAQDGYVRGVRYEAGDALCLDGRRLVQVGAPSPDVIEYRTFPDSFVKVLAYPTHFEVRTKSGLVLEYGTTSDSKVLAKGGVVRAWWLARTSDLRGNSVDSTYINNTDPSEGYTRLHAPKKIEYVDASRSVEFEYLADSNRVFYDAGMKLWSPNHLWHVRMRGPGGALVRDYRFEYESNFTTDRARLAAVHECAGDNASNCKPATYFAWKGGNGPGFSEIPTPVHVPEAQGASVMMLDMTGDGLADLVIPDLDPSYGQNPSGTFYTDWSVAPNSGPTSYFQSARVAFEQEHLALPEGAQAVPELGSAIDYNHDGRMDIFLHDIYGRYPTWRVLLSSPAGIGFQMADTGITRAYPTSVSPPILIKHPEASAHLADVDGDGMSDLIQCSFSGLDFSWVLHRWTPTGFDATPEPIGALFLHPCNAEFFPVDLDGDGKVELLVRELFLAGGGGSPVEGANYIALREDQPGTWSVEDTQLPKVTQYGRLIFLDFNGDGLSDALESGFSDHQLRVWLNTGEGFDGPYDALSSPIIDADKFINLATPIDDNGDGRQDLLIPLQEAGNVTPSWTILRSKGDTSNGTFETYPAGIPFDATLTTAGIELSHPLAPRVTDIDGDGKQDVILAHGATFSVFKSQLGEEDLLATITTGLNAHHAFSSPAEPGYVPDVAITYGHLIDGISSDASYLVRDGGDDCVYPRHCVAGSRSVVTGYVLNNGADIERSFSVAYRNGRYDRLNRSFLGFGERIVRDLITGASTRERYDTTTYNATFGVYPLAGRLLESWRETPLDSAQTALVHTEHFHQVVPTNGGATYFTLPVISHETRKENATTLSSSHHVISQYDEYGNALDESSFTDGVDLTNHVTRMFWNDPSTWVIGRLTSETQCSQTAGLEHCRTKSLTYNLFAEVETEGIASNDGDPDTILSIGFERDAFGNITRTTATDAIGQVRSSCTSYDADGVFPFAHRNAVGHLSFAKFHPGHGVPLTIVDANNHATQWALDGFGRVVKEVRPDGTTTSIERTWAKEGGKYVLKQTTRSDGFGERTVQVDGLGRPIKWWRDAPAVACAGCSAGEKIVEGIEFDALGEHVARRWKPAREGTIAPVEEYEFDSIGRLKTHTTPWKAVTSYSYSGLTTQIDHPGLPQSFTVVESDAIGRPVSVAKNLGVVTSYEYGPFGALRSVTDPGGATTTIERDALGRVALVDDPDRGTTFVFHDGFGQQRLSIDAMGRQVELEHDALGRLTKRTDSDGITSWAWDVATNGVGELAASVSAGGVTTSYVYDALSRPAASILSIGSESFAVGVGYDGVGRVDTITYPEGFAVKQEHDASGNLVAVRDLATNDPYWQLDEVDAAGRTTREIFGNEVKTERTYFDDRDRIETIHTWKGTTELQNLKYDYDERQNLKSRTDARPSGMAEFFAYDALDRIVCAALNDPQSCQTTYSYLPNGNIDMKSDVGTYSYDPGHPHAVQTAGPYGYGYDAVGNQTTRPGVSVAYTAFDLPHHFYAGTSIISLAYDADQRRIRKTAPTEETTYVGDLYERVVDLATGDVEHRFHIHGPERPVAVVKRPEGGTPTTRYVHVDHLGSTDVLSDEAGVEAERRSYDAFGARRNPVWGQPPQGGFSSQTRQGFTGHEGDEELGLINMRGRLYDPLLGRFLTPDPFVANPLDGQSFNAYSYVLNNPLAHVDPTGFIPEYQKSPADQEYENDPEVQRIRAAGCLGLECSRAPPATGDVSAEAAKTGAQKSPADVGTNGEGPAPPPTPKKEEDDAELSAQDKIVAAGVGAVETYAKMLEDYQRETMLNMMTLGSYGLIKGGYGFYSSAYANMKRDGIVLGALNTLNPLYHLAVLGADIKIAADNGDWKGVGGAVTKVGVAVVGMIVGAKAGPKGMGGAGRGGLTSSRALTAADLGIESTDAIVRGTFRIKNDRALVKVDYLGSERGLGRAALGAWSKLKESARAEGATSIRVETSPVIEMTGKLQRILSKLGFQSRANGTMFYEGAL